MVLAMAGIVVLTGMYGYWVGWAQPDEYTTADAVVVHAGQRHRQRQAMQLMNDGAAPVLTLLFASEYLGSDAEMLCQDQRDYVVLCPDPERQDTLGEAMAIDGLVQEYDWTSVIIVTSDYHLRRARHLDRKCTDVPVYGVGAKPRTLLIKLRAVAKEMVAMPLALLSSCD